MMRGFRAFHLLPFVAAAALAPSPAHAHLVDIRFGDFYGGALHLLTGLQYGLLLLALALFAGLHTPLKARWMLLAAPLGIGLGAAAALAFPGPQVTLWLTGALALLGVGTALQLRSSAPVLFALGTAIAALLGYENGLAMTDQTDTLLFISGLIGAAVVVVWLLTAVVARLSTRAAWVRIGFRTIGSWIAAVAIILMAFSVSGTPAVAG
ncbi:MAG: HupE/UreJ family protein [Pseudomonadota bacterium]